MRKRSVEKLVRKHILFSEEDWDKLESLYGGNIGPSAAVRGIVQAFFKSMEAKADATAKPSKSLDGSILDELRGTLQQGPPRAE